MCCSTTVEGSSWIWCPLYRGKNESDYDRNTRICEDSVINFSEGNYFEYKYFDQKNSTLRYKFRFGLCYTAFEYGKNLSVAFSYEFAISGREDLWP